MLKGHVFENNYNLCPKNAIYARSNKKDSFCYINNSIVYISKISVKEYRNR